MTYVKNLDRMQDDGLLLMDSTTQLSADTLATVGGSAAAGIVNIGAADGMWEMTADISQMDTTTQDELYILQLLGSNSSTFASGVVSLGCLYLGGTGVAGIGSSTGGLDTGRTTGKHSVGIRNRIGATVYGYVRLNIETRGTSPSITFNPDGVVLTQILGR